MLRGAGMESRFIEVNRKGVEAAMAAREAVGRPDVAVAGSISVGVAGDYFMHHGEPSVAELDLDAAFREQAEVLAEAGVDLLVLEMMMSPTYGVAAVEAALSTGIPVWLGISVGLQNDGSLVSLDDRVPVDELLDALVRPTLQAVTVMHSSVRATMPGLEAVSRHFDGPRGAYPESGDWLPPNWLHSQIEPEEFADAAVEWMSDGRAQIVGGCCGIGPTYIEALRANLSARRDT
jgi:S-methylmethionine-dependent homocysteine/selenocysteine methylase